MSWRDVLVDDEELKKCKKIRKQYYNYISITKNLVEGYLKENWEIDKEFKNKTRMKKIKPFDELFENEVWVLFSDLGFKIMNKDRKFCVPYNKEETLKQQVDVFAVDSETILIIECKATETKNKKQEFKTDIEALNGKYYGMFNAIKKEFPDHKIKMIFTTKNYNVSEPDKKRMQEFNISYFDEDKISYYKALTEHLGNAARYQLLGNLFANQKIQGLQNIVPAIFGKMGGYNYYSFSIEPETLLKLGYVLHRTDSNKDSMPTYQRLIKKQRLKSIHEFIENGGYFPNSIIVSIEPGKKGLKFEKINNINNKSLSKLGFLYLPQVYKSIYIIDGQHRLYGYSNSKYKESNTIPVVAFENLAQEEQIKIFMDINENQKAVPKNLRNTLDEDLKYESEDPKERREGLALKISRELGEDRNSPLYDRVVVGENTITPERCITLETLSKAIKESDFLSKYKNSNLISHGKFDRSDNDKTFEKLYPFLIDCFTYIEKELGEYEWQKTNDDKNAFVKNNVISGLIRVLNSLVIYLCDLNKINPLSDNSKKLFNEVKVYLHIIVEFWLDASDTDKIELSGFYGAGGPIKSCKTFEREINKRYSSFNPEGLTKYWGDRSKENTNEARKLIDIILEDLKQDIKEKIELAFGENKLDSWAPKDVVTKLTAEVANHNYNKPISQYKDVWDFIGFREIQIIMIHGSNWSEVFDKKFVFPIGKKGGKKETTKWLVDLCNISKKIEHSSIISIENFDLVKRIYAWLKKYIKEKHKVNS